MYRLRYILFLILSVLQAAWATGFAKSGPVVIVSSYNPDVKAIHDNIVDFSNTYSKLGGKSSIRIENMNCRALSDSKEWKERLSSLLSKYYTATSSPSVIVLLGVEASTTFFSLQDERIKKTPVVVGTRSNNIICLPDESTNLSTWNPDTKYMTKDFPDFNIVGGEVYNFDVTKNIELIDRLYPSNDSIVFLTDNTIGGVTIRSFFIKEVKKFRKKHITYLDGRKMSLPEVNNFIANLSNKQAIIIGTWRIDKTDSYALSNTIATLASSNNDVPAFSLTGLGMGSWALGSYTPDFHVEGSTLASYVYNFQQSGKPGELRLTKNNYHFDHLKLQHFNIDKSKLPSSSIILNEPESVFVEYRGTILIIVGILAFLTIALMVSLYFLRLSKILEHEHLQYSKEMEIARDRAEEANAMKSAFIANISHEIRTPLNAVIGFSQIITDPDMPLTDEEKVEYGEYIKLNSDTLLNLVNDILDISKMDAGRMAFNIVETDIVEICRTAAESAKANLQEGVSILTNLPGHSIMVSTDVLRLQQVFNNLLSNAKKFTTEGSITIALEASGSAKELLISVTDTGSGIPADKAEFVFERFKQLDSFKPGTGLGLAITRSIVESLGGHIWLDTSYTHGARFVFTHPML